MRRRRAIVVTNTFSEPCAESKRAALRQHVDENLLHRIFRVGTRARHAPRDGPHQAAELVDALTDRLLVAAGHTLED